MAPIIDRPSSRNGNSGGNRKPHEIASRKDPVVSFKTILRNHGHPRLVALGTLRHLAPRASTRGGRNDIVAISDIKLGRMPMTKRGRRAERLGLAGLVAGTALAFCFSAQAAEITYQRLLNASAEPQNWLMRMGNYSNWNHSTLNQINRGNVANLKVKFMASLGDPA